MAVRYGQAVYINQGLANEESKRNEIASDGSDNEVFECDLPLMNEAAAVDAYSTLTAPSIRGHMIPFDADQETAFVEHHTCGHDEDPPTPCVVVSRHEVTAPDPSPEIEPWVQPTGAHDAYNTGDQVTHSGSTWTSTHDANVWEPGVFGWSESP